MPDAVTTGRAAAPRPRWTAHLAWAVPLAFTLAAGLALYAPNLRLALVADDVVLAHHAMTERFADWLGSTGGLPFFRPLSRQVYFETMWTLFGASPLPYHLVTLGLALACAALLFAFAFLEAGPVAGTTAALVFLAQHGLSVATGWASCAQDLFALLFTLLAVHAARRARYRRAAAFVALALLCKETGAIAAAAVVMVAWQWADAHAPASTWRARLAHARLAWPSVAVVAVWAAVYAIAVPRLAGAPDGTPAVDVAFAPLAIARAFAFSGAALVNAEEGLSASLATRDLARLAGAVLCAAIALAVAGQLSRGWRQLVGPRAHPLRDGDEGLVALGLVWMLCALPVALSVGHRLDAYHALPLGAGFALLLSGLFARRRFAASVVVGALVATGPLADGAAASAAAQARHSVSTLPRLRRMSAAADALRGELRRRHATLPHGATVQLDAAPPAAVAALHGDDALQLWYGDPTLHVALDAAPAPACEFAWSAPAARWTERAPRPAAAAP